MKRLLGIIMLVVFSSYGMEKNFLDNEFKPSGGGLTVICGPMFSGKTEEIMKVVKNHQLQLSHVLVCKHSFDTRIEGSLSSRGLQKTIPALALSEPAALLNYSEDYDVIVIDEVQFFNESLIPVIRKLLDKGIKVIVSGLDTDFRKEPFGVCMPILLCIAKKVVKLKAVCQVCRKHNATYTQRLINGEPAGREDDIVVIDDGTREVSYEPRCNDCHVLKESLHTLSTSEDFFL
jgi:thymidine kinase